jgi:hypothetical protein
MTRIGMAEQSTEQRGLFEAEALGIVAAAAEQGLALRVLGSLAFHIQCPRFGYLQQALGRAYTDIDFAAYSKQAARIARFFLGQGYHEEGDVNVLFAGQRMIYHHPTREEIHVDVFFDRLNFSHEIRWLGRLEADPVTLPLAELLLEKTQIVKINEKDIIDTIMLLLEHPLEERDEKAVNIALISRLCARDWGLWRTTTMNLGKVAQMALGYAELSPEQKSSVAAQVDKALARINAEPKGLAWKARARIGDRVKWYQDVDEVI